MKRLPSFRKLLLILVLCGGMLIPATLVHANLLIMPIRITFQDRQRMADLTLVNTSNKTATYRMNWLYRRQKEVGGYDKLSAPLDPALDYTQAIVFSPRQVTLVPGGKQRIRLALRRPADLPEGEYRAHLQIQRLGVEDSSARRGAGRPGELQSTVAMNVGFALPVIVRQGAYEATAHIADPQFLPASEKKGPQLQLTINRSGRNSTNGKVTVYWTPPGGKEREIGRKNNVNVFHEITRRQISVSLDEDRIVGGMLRVIYEGDGPDKGVVFDDKSFPVGG